MIQTRICSYYGSRCKHTAAAPTTFLSLPERLRDRIYRYVGIVNDATIRIVGRSFLENRRDRSNFYFPSVIGASLHIRGRHAVSFFSVEDNDVVAKSMSYIDLSLSDSSVSADVARFICSHNKILLCCEDYTELSILLDLPLDLIKSLRHLTIHLNIASRHRSQCRKEYNCCHRSCCQPHKLHLLASTSRTFQAFIPIWHKVVGRLYSSANLSRLTFNVLCDVEDHTTAQLIVQPLYLEGLPTHAIRLGHERDTGLTDITRQAVLNTTGTKNSPFRFLDLPRELRQHVLSFTDLVVPTRLIHCRDNGKFCRPGAWQFESFCREFCTYQFAVYPPCTCWVPPTPMFLVCKDILPDARAIFFAYNHFIVSTDHRHDSCRGPGTLSAVSTFLRKLIPQEALPHLRSLTILVPAVYYDFSGTDRETYRDWVHTIDQIAPYLKKLALSLDMGFIQSHEAAPTYPGDSQQALEELLRLQEQIVRPLRKLNCLDKFFVNAMSPFDYSKWAPETTIKEQVQAHEIRLETLVMGNGYDSIARGKLRWLETGNCL